MPLDELMLALRIAVTEAEGQATLTVTDHADRATIRVEYLGEGRAVDLTKLAGHLAQMLGVPVTVELRAGPHWDVRAVGDVAGQPFGIEFVRG